MDLERSRVGEAMAVLRRLGAANPTASAHWHTAVANFTEGDVASAAERSGRIRWGHGAPRPPRALSPPRKRSIALSAAQTLDRAPR